MVDFRFYLNKQGIRGQKGEKGDTGFSPSIVEEVNTLTDYRLKIINEFDEFVTDNLRGSDYFDITDPNGTYLRFDKETGRAYTGALDQATSEAVGGARLASASDMDSFSENTIVTPALFADSLANLIVSPDGSLRITQNEETSKTEITFNSSTLDAVRAEINRVKQDLETESQTRLNADNQQQVAIDAERREREIQDNALQNQLSHLSDSYVTLSTEQDITGRKYFSNTIRGRDIALGIDKANNTWGILGSSTNSLTMGDSAGTIGFSLYKATSTSSPHFDINSADVRFTKGVPSVTQSGSKDYLVTQNNVFAGDNITVTKFGNGVKISSTGGAGAIIDDGDPATDKVYSSSKTSDLVGELGNEVNGIAGRLNTLEGEVKVATTENLGLVQPDGTTITIDSDGKITAVGGGDLPDNVVTTDTNQSISGSKTFEHHTLKISNEDNSMSSLVADFLTDAISIGKDGTSAISDRLKLAQPTVGKFYKEKAEVKFTPSGIVVDTWLSNVVSVDDIKAGNNIQLTKDQSSGEVTISATGGGSAPEVDNVTIEINEEGKLQTTVDINELQSKVEDLQLYKFPNATIEGDPTINNGQVSNFSTTNYLRFPFEFETKGRTWLLNGSFDTGSDVTTQQNIIDSLASVALAVRSGRLVLALSTNGTSFDLGEHLSMSDIEPNTKYYFKLSFSGTQYLLSLSTDKIDYMPEAVVSSTSPIASRPMTISSSGHPYGDIINLNDWDLTVGNVLVWQGMDDVGVASRLDVNVSNITETGKQAIKDIVGGGSGDSYSKEETDNLLANKEDKLTALDGITIEDKKVGVYDYSDEYQQYVNNNSLLYNTGKDIDILAEPLNLNNGKDLFINIDCYLRASSDADVFITLDGGNYTAKNTIRFENKYLHFYFDDNDKTGAFNLSSYIGKTINIKYVFDHSSNQITFTVINKEDSSIIKEVTARVTPSNHTYTKVPKINSIGTNFNYDLRAKDLVISPVETPTLQHVISVNIDNKTIISDNGVLKAVTESVDYYTREETNDLLADKQDKLTAGDGITIEEVIDPIQASDVDILNGDINSFYYNVVSKKDLLKRDKPITAMDFKFTFNVRCGVYNPDKYVIVPSNASGNYNASNFIIDVYGGYLYCRIKENGYEERVRTYIASNVDYKAVINYSHTTRVLSVDVYTLDGTRVSGDSRTISSSLDSTYFTEGYSKLKILSSSYGSSNVSIDFSSIEIIIDNKSITANDKTTVISSSDISEALDLLNGEDSTLLDSKLDKSTPHIIDTFVDGTSGYRIWSDGYCEQWGFTKPSSSVWHFTIQLLKTYQNQDYNIQCTAKGLDDYDFQNDTTSVYYANITTSSFNVARNTQDTTGTYWKTSGYLAEGEY